jgi:molybdopterin-guanine dinucleotide biosynthesis protein A
VSERLVIGLFVGGRGTRLGGVAKGNLRTKAGERLLVRLRDVCRAALPDADLVLVGASDAYSDLALPALSDSPPGIGPLGGLRALLLHAQTLGATNALALACDLPYLGAPLIRRLAVEQPHALLLAPREGDLWHVLTARYGAGAIASVDATLQSGERALQRVATRLGARAVGLALDATEMAELRDWDVPGDL